MKKLLLLATIGVAGFLSAKETVCEDFTNDNGLISKECSVETNSLQQNNLKKIIRLTIHTTCGESFSEVVTVPDNFTNVDYISIAAIVNALACDEVADSWDVN